MKYLYRMSRIYPRLRGAVLPAGLTRDIIGGGCVVEPNTLVCYDVVTSVDRSGARLRNLWTFKVEGFGDTLFQVFHAHALAEDTPENHEACILAALAHKDAQDAQARFERLEAAVRTIDRTTP